jgi:hypothetical protein
VNQGWAFRVIAHWKEKAEPLCFYNDQSPYEWSWKGDMTLDMPPLCSIWETSLSFLEGELVNVSWHQLLVLFYGLGSQSRNRDKFATLSRNHQKILARYSGQLAPCPWHLLSYCRKSHKWEKWRVGLHFRVMNASENLGDFQLVWRSDAPPRGMETPRSPHFRTSSLRSKEETQQTKASWQPAMRLPASPPAFCHAV